VKKKPIFFYAPSMGPFTFKFDNPLRRFLLKRASAIVLREDLSGEYLEKQLGLKSIVTCDSAMQNTVPEGYIDRYNNLSAILKTIEEKRVIGMTITVLKWHPVYRKDAHLENRIRESISGAIEVFLDKGYCILLMPQIFGDVSDVPLLEQFREANKDRIFILPGNVDSYGQQLLISKLHSMIGMRYHSNIFAAKGKIPFLSISYEHKMKGFMDKLGLSELTMNVEEITAQGIIDKFEYLEYNYESVKRILNERVPELQRLSSKTTEIVVNGIEREYRDG
jgi:colanic acid/amylovoran biosynthesis protein